MQGKRHSFPQIWEKIEKEWEEFLRNDLPSLQNWAFVEEKIEVSDDEVKVFIHLPIPIGKEQVHFDLEGNMLRIKMEDRQERRIEDERSHFYQISKRYKREERVLQLPVPVRKEKSRVEWREGGIWIIFPRI
ncbi:hypothetical protein CULT_2050001 [[Clostridium] ultunense Esp]|uniref:Hsp20/alpha crystallin family protein n=1 Tax=Thermicanus aegyptius TaxID=94009 RepID=UPI0002B6FAA0|nr:Hsp20/alpha crystallin family protein [Thermicanus aegyptius]CCQ94803.1 hypothetical protein CULT_2050001 [[Clostridium] ultunense Esp]